MKTRAAAVLAALIIGVSAPVSSVMAFGNVTKPNPSAEAPVTAWLGVHDAPGYTACPLSSAAEGNANQQNFPVKQYGQTAGGTRC